nr:uncharacterized mitochondrial protein AtMg00810-like [Tanacetum cinerariifolium]
MIGSLMYLTASRPDIMFAVCACARHQVTPKECHLHAVKRIFRYLKGHPKLGLWYPKESPFELVAYSDSDYGGATQDRKSTSGGCQFLGRRLISWQCKKQTIVATSTTKVKYVAAASCCRQVMWIHNQLLDYGYNFMNTNIYIDNNSAIWSDSEQRTHEFMHVYLAFASVYVWIGNTIMARLLFCDYHNMVAILEKGEHNVDFHPMVDFIEASPLRYALTVKPTIYVSHIRQFWSTAWIETTKEETKILATVDGIVRTISESSLRRNLKLRYEEGINSLPDTKLFENLTLMGYNISPNQKFTFQKVPFHTRKLFTTLRKNIPSFSGRIVPLFDTMLVHQGEGSGTPTESNHTPSPEAPSPSHTTHTSPSLPPDEPASPQRDVSQGEACPTDSGFIADQDRTTIAKSSTFPHDSAPRVTSPAAVEGSMQQTIFKLTALCTSLQRQLSELIDKFQAQEGRSMDEGEAATERISDDSEEMATVLTSMDAVTVLASGVIDVLTGSGSIPTASTPAEVDVPTGSDVVPTASLVYGYTSYKKKGQRGWKVKDFRGMTFEEVEAKFNSVWKQIDDFIPMGSKTLSNRPPTGEKEMELWVELNRMYEPDKED